MDAADQVVDARSSSCTGRPLPSGPPTPSRKAGSIRWSAPPAGLSTMPKRGSTVRMPAARAGSVAASHSRATLGQEVGRRRRAWLALGEDLRRRGCRRCRWPTPTTRTFGGRSSQPSASARKRVPIDPALPDDPAARPWSSARRSARPPGGPPRPAPRASSGRSAPLMIVPLDLVAFGLAGARAERPCARPSSGTVTSARPMSPPAPLTAMRRRGRSA